MPALPKTPLTPTSKGNVPALLKAAMNMRIAFEGVVPIDSVASKKRSFSAGRTLATTGVILSDMVTVFRLWYDLVCLGYTLSYIVTPICAKATTFLTNLPTVFQEVTLGHGALEICPRPSTMSWSA